MTAALLPSGHHTVACLLRDRAESCPDAPFLVCDNNGAVAAFTYAQTNELAAAGSAVLHAAGVAAGHRFAVVLENCTEFFASWFGAALLGAVMVPINPHSSIDEFRYILDHAGCAVAVSSAQHAARLREARPDIEIIVAGDDFDTCVTGKP